jgi:hypothetical protein
MLAIMVLALAHNNRLRPCFSFFGGRAVTDDIQNYYKINIHFQCCIKTKLLKFYPKYLHGFVVHVSEFI